MKPHVEKPKKKNPAAQALGRLGGGANTPAQIEAKRRNAKLAGRPGRICTDCGQPAYGGHKNRKLDTHCHSHSWTWQTALERNEKAEKPKPEKRKAG